MDRSDVVTLVSIARTQDEYGVLRETKTERGVFCSVDSVTRAEFFEGGKSGFKPEFRITMFFGDYAGETELVYNGTAYGVYRTFRAKTDVLELYVERKGGVNGTAQENPSP